MAADERKCRVLNRLLAIAEVEQVTGRERTTISRWVKANRFPRPVYLGNRRGWWSDELDQWMNDNVKPRSDA